MTAHYLMCKGGTLGLSLATDTFKACKLINICQPSLVSVFDASDLRLTFN